MIKENYIFIVGIKGVAMANLAVIFKKIGKNVTGADLPEEFITDELLKKHDISYQVGFEATALPADTGLVIYSAAHGGTNNPMVVEAKKRNIKVISQAEAIGDLMNQSKIKIAVAGCHGKTTIASLLSYALIKLRAEPNYLVGTPSFNEYDGSNYHATVRGSYFVVEADEYAVNPPSDKTPKFHFLDPDYIICPNIDFDHPDVYKNIDEVKAAYLKFFNNKKLNLCNDDPILFQCIKTLKRENYITYGYGKDSGYRIEHVETDSRGSQFDLVDSGEIRMTFRISLFGEKNVSNAAGAISLLLRLGFAPSDIQKSIAGFTGAKRRFETVYTDGQITLIDDYAHHPAEIETTIKAARSRFPGKKLIVIFQPHTYSRTQTLLPDFAESLSLADLAYVLPIFPSAREDSSQFTISSEDIVKLNPKKLIYTSSKEQLIQLLASNFQLRDIVITMGAGDVYKLKDDIISVISNGKSQIANRTDDVTDAR